MTLLKGIGYADKTIKDSAGNVLIDGVARIASLNPDWWYNWNQKRFEGTVFQQDPPFTPMLWSDSQVRLDALQSDLAALNMPHQILGFNEPDKSSQSNMTVAEALAVWPQLEAAAATEGLRIGSPVTASPTSAWMADFMTQAAAQGRKIDFVALHIYTNPDVANTLKKIDDAYAKWGKPIWVTESAVADFTAVAGSGIKSTRYTRTQVNDYMVALWPELKKRSYVERFAWKTRDVDDEQMWFSALFNDDGSLTGTGQKYRDLV